MDRRANRHTDPDTREILAAFPDVMISLEIKQTRPSMATGLCDVLLAADAVDRVYLSSNDDTAVYEARDACPGTVLITTTYADLVFSTSEFTPINPSNLRRSFNTLTTDAGPGHWHPHELRHSAASIMSTAGVPLEHIADTLGHDGTRMTALVYRHAITPTITTPNIMSNILGNDASPPAPDSPDTGQG